MPTVIVIDGPNLHSACNFGPIISYLALASVLNRISCTTTGDEHPTIYWVDRESPPNPPPFALRAMGKAGITPYLVHTPRVGPPGQTTPKDVDTAIAACAFWAVYKLLYRSSAQIEDIHCIIVSGDYDMIHIIDGLARMGVKSYVAYPPASGNYTPSHLLEDHVACYNLTEYDIHRITSPDSLTAAPPTVT